MSKLPFPCKNCICFPICKSQITEYISENTDKYKPVESEPMNITYYMYLYVLRSKCSIIKDWIEEQQIKNSTMLQRVNYLYTFFEGVAKKEKQ